jgi:diguanylate cyclase (GGDEF)-like protein
VTGLPNRTLYRDRLRQAISAAESSGEKLAVLALNVNRFRTVYDSFGQAGSDRFLQLLAQRLSSCIEKSDTLARDAHDNFFALLHNVNGGRRLNIVLQRMLAGAQGPWELDGKEFASGVSIGVAIWPDDGADGEELMQSADWALREARAEGGGTIAYFDPRTGERTKHRAKLEADLRRALKADEFVVHYQPQVDLRSGEVVGLEALVRWQHPERGLIPPSEFIPLAEETGLIAELDLLVLQHACGEVKELSHCLAKPLRLAINISAAHLRRSDVAEVVAAITSEAGFDRRCLEVEVTETSILSDITAAEHSLRVLRDEGISVALDDFGTGYSSLSHLRQLSIHQLKIDRSFVMNLPDDREAGIIATTVLALAQTLGFGVVAEGIETDAQLRFLVEAGCTTGQGYLFGRPAPAARWLERWGR